MLTYADVCRPGRLLSIVDEFLPPHAGPHFTCFTGTKVQILTQKLQCRTRFSSRKNGMTKSLLSRCGTKVQILTPLSKCGTKVQILKEWHDEIATIKVSVICTFVPVKRGNLSTLIEKEWRDRRDRHYHGTRFTRFTSTKVHILTLSSRGAVLSVCLLY
jgi:hypothetical protein